MPLICFLRSAFAELLNSFIESLKVSVERKFQDGESASYPETSPRLPQWNVELWEDSILGTIRGR